MAPRGLSASHLLRVTPSIKFQPNGAGVGNQIHHVRSLKIFYETHPGSRLTVIQGSQFSIPPFQLILGFGNPCVCLHEVSNKSH